MDLSNITVNAQSSVRIAGEKVLYFDPFEVKGEPHDADLIFITHEHYDHFQPESIAKIRKADTVLVAPLSMEAQVREIAGDSEPVLWEPGTVQEICGLAVKTVPAYNKLKPFHPKRKNWQGYLVRMDGIAYYVAGDTDVNDDIRKVRCDVAILPVGGKYTMDKTQAADYIAEIRPTAVVPTHYGSIVGSPSDGSDFKKLVEKADPQIQVELKLK